MGSEMCIRDRSDLESIPFTVDLNKLCNGLPALSANFEGATSESYLCIMPGEVLSKLYDEYGQRLLESNVRTFLGTRGKVNTGMRNTLLTNPDDFFAYNNGLTLTATSLKKQKKSDGLKIVELENLQIVNGGQTTSSIFFSPPPPPTPMLRSLVGSEMCIRDRVWYPGYQIRWLGQPGQFGILDTKSLSLIHI